MRNKKIRKTLSAILSAALLLQSGMAGMAQENSPAEETAVLSEAETAARTADTEEEAARRQSEAESEAARQQSEAESEAARQQSEAESEAARQQSEAESEAAKAAAESEAARQQSEAESEAAKAAAESEAAQQQSKAESEAARQQSEAESETARKESETQEKTEDKTQEKKEKKKKKKSKETERSDYENGGKTMSAKDAASGLQSADSYLFAAESIEAENAEELLEAAATVTGEEAKAILDSLKTFSLELADAQSSDDLEVINLYADQEGRLDETQLEALSEEKHIDVSDKFFVVNIIADDAEQILDFSDYELMFADVPVEYENGGQACDIIYNFAAWDDGEFVGYKGSVTLKADSVLQGIYLAPEAEVKLQSDLAGAVYAKKITLEASVEEVLKLTFAQSSIEETEAQSETVTEGASSGEAQSETVTEEAASDEAQSEAVTADTDSDEEATGSVAEIQSEAVTEGAASDEAQSEAVTADTDSDEEATGSVAEIQSEAVPGETASDEAQSETEPISEEDALIVEGMMAQEEAAEFNTNGAVMAVAENDTLTAPVLTVVAEDETTALTGAVFVVRDKDGNLVSVGNSSDEPQYELHYMGTALTIAGLTAGEYILSQIAASTGSCAEDGTVTAGSYQIAEDLAFQVTDSEEALAIKVVNKTVPSGGKKLAVSAKAYYRAGEDDKTDVELTAETEINYYAAVFAKLDDKVKRVSDVRCLTIEEGQTQGGQAGMDQTETELTESEATEGADPAAAEFTGNTAAVFEGLEAGTYYLAATDKFGTPLDPEQLSYRLQETDEAAGMTMVSVVIGEQDAEAVMQYVYQNGQYPEEQFSYMADMKIGIKVLGKDGKALKVDETFYAAVYSDEGLTTALTETPIALKLEQASSASATCQVKMTTAEAVFYIAEVTKEGNLITPTGGFAYAVTYPENETGAVTVACGTTAEAEIQNKLNDSVVKIGVTDGSGAYLSGAVLAIKNSSGRVIAVNNTKTFESAGKATELKNLLEDGKTYYLSEIQAPEGYTPAADMKFTVKAGKTTEVVLKNTKTASTEYHLTVSKQVYSGEHQVYAYDTTNKSYAKAGAYTFYAALFSDAKHTKKVSDVQKITVSGFGGTTVFKNLEQGKTYYLAETTQYGEVYKSSTSTRTIKYTDSGKIAISKKNQSAIIQNVYNKLPGGYRYTGTLTLKKQVLDTAGNPLAVNGTFYVGIYRTSDYSDTPTVVKLELKNASTASVKRRILLSGENNMTYYLAELDANGNRLTEESEYSYAISIDQPTAVIAKGEDQVVTVTNKVKSSKATLYITKKVYEGTAPKAVNETFYAGLFKDAEFKELYTKPIALKLENKSELTLKLTLNLGTSAKTTIYIAEVDQDGNVIRNQRDFGYEVKVVNSTAAFTQDRLEIQSILVNTVYGSVSSDQWNEIYDDATGSGQYGDAGSYGDDNYGDYYYSGGFSGNGVASGDGGSVATGDETPVSGYLLLLSASVLLLVGLGFKKRRRSFGN